MQSNQHASNHPTPIRNLARERSLDNSKHSDTSKDDAESQVEDSWNPSDVADALIKPSPGRRPERSEENTGRYRR